MASKKLGSVVNLTAPWQGIGPFIFAVHHLDAYPKGNGKLGVDPALLRGRDIGSDFGNPSGWNMYHGTSGVPGFPAHPHRGFETVTLVRTGLVDHADSTGAGARFGMGDTQWVTAGGGIVHSEMFPLVNDDKPNPLELYQVWLNLPAKSKMAPPQFKMFWNKDTPTVTKQSPDGLSKVIVVAGQFEDTEPLAPPAASWANEADSDVAIWVIDLGPNASLTLPAPKNDLTKRMVYVHGGSGVRVAIAGQELGDQQGFRAEPGSGAEHSLLVNNLTDKPTSLLLLQGMDIGEPIAQHGPFVMNTRDELQQAFTDYRRTRFGGWRFDSDEPVYGKDTPRFADLGDGKGKVFPE